MKKAELTQQACEKATVAQMQALARILDSPTVQRIDVTGAGFDLPSGYLTFRVDYNQGSSPMYGGISPEGEVST